ncbi:MAG: hypothetical protein Q9204_007010 [Flavoplaca sp. TL-2023a]
MTDIIIYAELLLNIRQITVVASLPSTYNNTTLVTLSEDRQSLSVAHDGQRSTVKLPAPVRPGFNPTIAPGSTKTLSFRLPIADDIANSLSSRDNTREPRSLGSAASMEPRTRVACRFCQMLLVKEQVKSWKDLPSENWAEMMDFWHCHKPDSHDDDGSAHKQDGVRKGYGAASSIRPTSGVGLVDVTSFHLLQLDCNITVGKDAVLLKVASWQQEGGLSFITMVWSPIQLPETKKESARNRCTLFIMDTRKYQTPVICASCNHSVGVASDTDARIYKWNTRLQSNPLSEWESHSAQKLVSAQLLAMIESQGIQKFVIQSEIPGDDFDALLVWIFTPNMYFSSTLVPQSPKQVMKLYYKTVHNPEELLEQQSLKIDELQIPTEVFQDLYSDIKSSTQLLPTPARKFQEWAVGLLER